MTTSEKRVDFTAEELAGLRKDFPITARIGRGGQPLAYLDSSATAQKPIWVMDAVSEFYSRHNGAVNRGTNLLADESTTAYEKGRDAVAKFIDASSSEEVVWTRNATEGVNLLAYSMLNASLGAGGAEAEQFKIGPADRIVVTRAEHHANLVPWQQLAERTGAEFAWLDLTSDGCIDLDTLNVITPNTKVVAFTHVSNVTGAISPVEAIVAAARKVGALVVLDTTQSAAHMPISVRELGADFAVLSGHKLCGPTGIGVLWGRKELLDALPPFMTGGSMITDVQMEKTSFHAAPARFEAGTQAVGQIVGFKAALDYLSEVSMERVAAHEAAITRQLLEGIKQIDGVHVLGPKEADNRVAVVSFVVDGVHPHDVGQILDSHSIAIRVGHHCAIPLHKHFGVRASARASASLITSAEEIDRFLDALGQVRKFFGV